MRDTVPSARYCCVCNVCVNGESGSSLLIESTDSMIFIYSVTYIVFAFAFCASYAITITIVAGLLLAHRIA